MVCSRVITGNSHERPGSDVPRGGALLGLIAVLATLQYRWLGRISDDERERRSAALAAQAQGVRRRLRSRAHARVPALPVGAGAGRRRTLLLRVAGRYERWQSTARFPRLIRDVYVVGADRQEQPLQRFNPAGRMLEPAEWPESFEPLRDARRTQAPRAVGRKPGAHSRAAAAALGLTCPPLSCRCPVMAFHPRPQGSGFRMTSAISYAVLALDRGYIAGEVLPALAREHFGDAPDGADFQVAVVSGDDGDVIYRSSAAFAPARDGSVDASSGLFQVRPGEFGGMVSEIRRISTWVAAAGGGGRAGQFIVQLPPGDSSRRARGIETGRGEAVGPAAPGQDRAAVVAGTASMLATRALAGNAQWRLVVQHRAGSLEAAVDATRRRNLAISSGILGLLGVSVGFLIVSTRRAQRLARQQMEFVAAVSHELRTPLAVIRSAGDNLAEGVVGDERQVRKYGDLVRGEGRRLTEMVEQILEFAGIHSGSARSCSAP
jgi:hypothetical protein